jgi:3-hydroxypropionyl-CoA synthetase (ADP-forming)
MNEPEKPGPASQGPSLSSYGFVFPRSGLATDEEQAARIAGAIGYPVALKMVSSDIMHKTDVGGVELDVGSDDEVRRACRRIRESVASRAPHARVDGIRVEEMVSRGIEVIFGLKDDAQFGQVIMFGLGGIFTELLDDVSLRVLPIEEIDAREMLSEIRGAGILRGYRGRPAVSEDMLVRLLLQAGALAADLGSDLGSVDLNPVAVWGDEHRVLDFKSSPPVDRKAAHRRDVDTRHLETFFKARSVAVIGASATPGKIGYAVLESLAKHEYGGRVYPVNPGRDCILGLPAYPSLSAIPERVDLVVCTVDLALVPGLMKECATLGTHNLVVVSGGGKELGGERAAVEAEIRRLARELDVRVVGPNCIGVFDGRTRLDTFFQPQERMIRPPAGPVAMMSQSGTVGIAFMEDMAAVGMSSFVSYGNRADVDEADLLTYLAEDPDTRVIALYVEGFENGRGFLEAARRAAARKPVVIFKSGTHGLRRQSGPHPHRLPRRLLQGRRGRLPPGRTHRRGQL